MSAYNPDFAVLHAASHRVSLDVEPGDFVVDVCHDCRERWVTPRRQPVPHIPLGATILNGPHGTSIVLPRSKKSGICTPVFVVEDNA